MLPAEFTQDRLLCADGGLCRMQNPLPEATRPTAPQPAATPSARRGWRFRGPRLGIGWRLGLGLAAVAAVLMVGESLATRTAGEALDAVRSMQNEHEPLANRANAVLEQLLAYDRAVGEYMQARSADDFTAITEAGDALEAAVAAYFSSFPAPPVTAAAGGLRAQLTRHIANARQLASRAAQRAQWARSARPRSSTSTSASPPPAAPDSPSTAPRWWPSARSPSSQARSTPCAATASPRRSSRGASTTSTR